MVSVAAGAEEGRQISERLRGSQPAPRLPACDCLHVRTHPRGDASADHRLLFFLATKRLPVPSRPWARPWMSTLRFTAGVGVGSSGACTIGPVPKHQRFWVLLCAPTRCSLAISFLFSLLFLLVCVALQLKSRSLLRYHTPRLCRIAVFSIQPIVLSDHDQWGLDSADSVSGGSSNHLHHRSDHVLCLPSSVAARPREMAIQSKPKPGAPRLLLATSIDVRPAPP